MSISSNCTNLPTGSTGDVYNAFGQLCWTGTTTSTQAACGTGSTRGTSLVYDGAGLLTSSTSTTGGSTTNASYAFDTQSGSSPRMLTDLTNAYVYGPLLFGGTAPVEQINLATKQVDFMVAAPSGVQAIFTGGTTGTHPAGVCLLRLRDPDPPAAGFGAHRSPEPLRLRRGLHDPQHRGPAVSRPPLL